MSSVPSQLAQLAAAAEIHARQRHHITLNPADWAQVDTILKHEREQGDSRERESIALCYGAWIGQCLLQTFPAAQWIAMDEPVPPRLKIGGLSYSPIDAVRRRLMDYDATSIYQLVQSLTDRPSLFSVDQDAVELNRSAWDRRANDGKFATPHTILPASREEILAGLDPWLRNIELVGCHVLCLAAAGGTHGPLYAAAGARVTVADFSPALLAIDQERAEKEGLDLETLEADLRDLSALPDQQFDIVLQPVSTCYIPNLLPMYRQIFRVLKPGGSYLSQHKSPASLQAGTCDHSTGTYRIVQPSVGGLPLSRDSQGTLPHREPDMVEYVHPLNDLIGGMCRSDFVIEDFEEPVRADAWAPRDTTGHLATFLPPYLKILARRPVRNSSGVAAGG